MRVEDVKKVGVVGAGTMGPGIAASLALGGYPVVVKELEEYVEKAKKSITGCFPALVRKGKLTEEEKDATLARIQVVTTFDDFKDCQFIIDATPDKLEIKTEVFRTLSEICAADTVLATTSSIMSVTALGAVTKHPENVVGMHFCIPAHLMALVEVARAIQTSDETMEFSMAFLRKIGKTPVTCKDAPGFIVNALLFPFINRAIKMVENGYATPADIDTACKLGLGHSMGPFELLDMSSIDTAMTSFGMFYEQTQDPELAIPNLLRKKFEAGHLGRKVGKGFHDYSDKK